MKLFSIFILLFAESSGGVIKGRVYDKRVDNIGEGNVFSGLLFLTNIIHQASIFGQILPIFFLQISAKFGLIHQAREFLHYKITMYLVQENCISFFGKLFELNPQIGNLEMKLISEKTEVEVGNDIRSAMLDSLADRLKEEFLENKFSSFSGN